MVLLLPALEGLQHHVGGAVPQGPAGHVAVLDVDHGVLRVVGQVVDDHLAGRAELDGQAVGHLAQERKAFFTEHGKGLLSEAEGRKGGENPLRRVCFFHHITAGGEIKAKTKKG